MCICHKILNDTLDVLHLNIKWKLDPAKEFLQKLNVQHNLVYKFHSN